MTCVSSPLGRPSWRTGRAWVLPCRHHDRPSRYPQASREHLDWRAPQGQQYGAHLSQEQVAELVPPYLYTLGLVKSWLEHYSVPSSFLMTHGGNWLEVTCLPVSQANDLLGASYQLYRHVETNDTVLLTIGYALLAAFQTHMQTVVPITYVSSPRTL
ncbi:hypothetical protein BJY52DRAFT_1269821 [Lactarius psammicola]|nr:hypothetical protein BJY52DRAFT_1269821 [Lactarius psammicola]